MGLLSFGSKLVRGATHLALNEARRNPATAILTGGPLGLAAVMAAGSQNVFGSPKTASPGLPALPALPGGMPAYATGAGVPATTGGAGVPALPAYNLKGKVLPPLTEAVANQLVAAGFLITGTNNFRIIAKPRDRRFVIVHHPSLNAGMPWAMEKHLARAYGLWKPGHKPPISVGMHQALIKAKHAVHAVRKFNGLVTYVHNNVGAHGKVIVHSTKKKGGRK